MRQIFFVVIICITMGCAEKRDNKELHRFLNDVSSKPILKTARQIFIIPNAGCSGCILNSEQFMFDNIDKIDSTYFILTSFQSIKAIRAKYASIREGILNHDRVILDIDYKFASVPIDQKYPLIVFISNGEISEIQPLDVENVDLLERIKVN